MRTAAGAAAVLWLAMATAWSSTGAARPLTTAPDVAMASDPAASEDPLHRIPTGPPVAFVWPGARPGTRFVVRRGAQCEAPRNIRFSSRRVRTCHAESRFEGTVQDDGLVTFRPLPEAAPATTLLPVELALQWRTCPWREVAALQGERSPWVPYEDREVGRCYVWRPLDVDRWQAISPLMRGHLLDDLHPYLAASLREMAVRAAAVGVTLHLIWTSCEQTVHYDKPKKKKKGASKTKAKSAGKRYKHRGGRYSYMHPWGLAADLTIGGKKPLYGPDRHYRRGSEVWRTFRTLGSWASEMGLVWLGETMRGELVHFEFHPNTWGTIDGDDLTALIALRRKGGLTNSHNHWRYVPGLASPFLALREPEAWQ